MDKKHCFSNLGKLALLLSVLCWSFTLANPSHLPVPERMQETGFITFINNSRYSTFFPDDHPRNMYFFVVDVTETKNIYLDDLVYDDMLSPGGKITYRASEGEEFIIYVSYTTSANDWKYQRRLYPGVRIVEKLD